MRWSVTLFTCLLAVVACSRGSEEVPEVPIPPEAPSFVDVNGPFPPSPPDTEETRRDGITPEDERLPEGESVMDIPPVPRDLPDPPVGEDDPLVETLPDEAPLDASIAAQEPVETAPGVVATVCSGAECGSTWVCAPRTPVPRRRAGATFSTYFNERSPQDAPDMTIERATMRFIGAATPGSTIRLAVFHLAQSNLASALINAARCGVHVRVVIDGPRNADPAAPGRFNPAVESLLAAGRALSAQPGAGGSVRVIACTSSGAPPGMPDRAGGSCLGQNIMHDKFFTITPADARARPGDPWRALAAENLGGAALRNGAVAVVGVSSHNYTSSQNHRHNALLVVRNDLGILNAYNRAFTAMESSPDPSRPAHPYRFESGDDERVRAHFFPRPKGEDTIVEVLDNVRCERGATVHVAMAFFVDSRIRVARALRRLSDAGCAVRVVVGDAAIRVGDAVYSALRGGPRPVQLWRYGAGDFELHAKYLLIHAPFAGSTAPRSLVLTGSHNYTRGALRDNDETILRVESARVYNAFLADWNHIRRASRRNPLRPVAR